MKIVSAASVTLLALGLLISPALGQSFQAYFNDPEDLSHEYDIRDEFVSRINGASSTIDLCIYNLQDAQVRNALTAWNNNGAHIARVVTDVHPGDTNHSTHIQPLIDDGIEIEYDIPKSYLSHNKFAVFDSTTVWTGSWNHTYSASNSQWNNAIAIQHATLVSAYQSEFNQMMGVEGTLYDGLFHQYKSQVGGTFALGGGSSNDRYRTSPQNSGTTAEQRIVAEINESVSGDTIYFAIYTFNSSELSTTLQNANARGVMVRGIFDKGQADTVFDDLYAAGCGVFFLSTDNPGPVPIPYIHHKYMVIDRAAAEDVVITGSANFTDVALKDSTGGNDENTLILHDTSAAQAYIDNWLQMAGETGLSPGDVVINEIAWMGTTSPSDEWIELYNTTGSPIDVYHWSIDGADNPGILNFSERDAKTTTTIPAGGYLIYANDSAVFSSGATEQIWDATMDMSNTGSHQVILYSGPNATGVTLDTANDGGTWAAGNPTGRITMERLNPYGDGTVRANWGDYSGTPFAQDTNSNWVNGSPGVQNSVYSGPTPTPTATMTPTPTTTPAPWIVRTSFEYPEESDPIGYTLSGGVPDDPGSDQWGRWASNPRTGSYSFAAQDCSGEGTCTFDSYDVSGYANVVVHLWLKTSGAFESSPKDWARAYVQEDALPWTYFLDETGSALNTHSYQEHTYNVADSTNSIVIVYQVRDNANTEYIWIDDVTITGDAPSSPTPTPTVTPTPTATPTRTPWLFPRKINFQPDYVPAAPGHAVDDSSAYGTHGDYGWQ